MSRPSAGLSSPAQHVKSPEFGGKYGREYLNTKFPRLTLQDTAKSCINKIICCFLFIPKLRFNGFTFLVAYILLNNVIIITEGRMLHNFAIYKV